MKRYAHARSRPGCYRLTPDPDEHLVQVPRPCRRARRPHPTCDHRAEGDDPAPNGLVGHLDAALFKRADRMVVPQFEICLLDHFVGAGEERARHLDTERLGSLQVDE